MSWADFDQASSLERDMLLRALPLVPTESSDRWRMRIDPAASEPVHVQVSAHAVTGATPGTCVALLRIRPLLVGAAWKVLDLLLEEAFTQAGEKQIELRTFGNGQFCGRFMLMANPGSTPSLQARLVAVTLAGQAGHALGASHVAPGAD